MGTIARVAVLLLLTAAVVPATALAGGNTNFAVGQRDLRGEWEPFDRQWLLGATIDWGRDDWPVHLAWGINGSAHREEIYGTIVDVTAVFVEFSFGALWLPIRDRPFRPYIGAGIAGIAAAYQIEVLGLIVDDRDQDLGYYANAGIYWRLGRSFNLGVDLRYGGGSEFDLPIPAEAGKTRLDGGYLAYSLLLGFGWGN